MHKTETPNMLGNQNKPRFITFAAKKRKRLHCCLLLLLFDMRIFHASLACYHPFGLDFRAFNLF